MAGMDTFLQYHRKMISSRLNDFCDLLYDCYKTTLLTRTWIIGWTNLLENTCMVILFAFILPTIHNEEALKYLCNEPMSRIVIVIKSMQLFFSAILLIGTYKGQRLLIFCWIVAATTLTSASIVVFTISILLTPYNILAAALLIVAACDLCCIYPVIRFYKYKETEFAC